MKTVLVACETSGVVRDAFEKKGWYAISCDILPSKTEGKHIQADILGVMDRFKEYDITVDLLIAHPPCTHLAVSGARWFPEKRKDGRQQQGIDFFMALTKTDIQKFCIENPVGIMSTHWRKPNQIIQPWMFGHPEKKATCLWLKGLPILKETDNVREEMLKLPKNRQNKIHYLPPSKDRWKLRSKTFQGIAEAMANQWT